MAVLKKLKSATLIETLVATIIIIIVFMVASLILNNLLQNSFSKKTHTVEARMHEIEYLISHNTIKLPYAEEFGQWRIQAEIEEGVATLWLECTATHKITNKEVRSTHYYEAAN